MEEEDDFDSKNQISPQFGQNYRTNRKITCETPSAIIIKVI